MKKLLLMLVLLSSSAFAQLDAYGGRTDVPITASAIGTSGYFRVAKQNGRWWLVTPSNNAMWLQAVQNANSGTYSGSKYAGNSTTWMSARNARLRAWNFNGLGEYLSGSAGGTSPLPFIMGLTPAQDIELNGSFNYTWAGCTQAPKEIVSGLTGAANLDLDPGKQFVDPYDPCYAKYTQAEYNYFKTNYYATAPTNVNIIGIGVDDADGLYGFKTRGNDDGTVWKPSPNPAAMVAFARPTYLPSNNVVAQGNGAAWGDGSFTCAGMAGVKPATTLCAKLAWINYLKAKYATIGALNTAWGTSSYYTSFDSTTVTKTNVVLYNVGYRTIIGPLNGWERLNDTNGSGDPAQSTGACAPTGTGACIGVWVHYNGPCPVGLITVSSSVTISGAFGQYAGVTPNNINGTFTVTQVGGTYACTFKFAQSANTYDDGPLTSTATVAFPETKTSFSLALTAVPVTASTVTLNIPGGVTATDDGAGNLTGTGVAAGSVINYTTGAITLNLSAAPPQGDITGTWQGDGWGVGTGVNDENGQHTAWFGYPLMSGGVNGGFKDSGASAGVQTDIAAFLYLFAKQYKDMAVTAIRQVDTNHLIFGPDAINNYGMRTRSPILQGLAEGTFPNTIDVMEVSYDGRASGAPMASNMADNNAAYDLMGKPVIMWYGIMANADSGFPSCTDSAPDTYATQALRGQHMRDVDVPGFLAAQGTNADHYVIGYDWWAWTNSNSCNFGLVSFSDNSYNGSEDVTATVSCSAPTASYTCGGEAGNYGDFSTPATQANALWLAIRNSIRTVGGSHQLGGGRVLP